MIVTVEWRREVTMRGQVEVDLVEYREWASLPEYEQVDLANPVTQRMLSEFINGGRTAPSILGGHETDHVYDCPPKVSTLT